MRGGKKLRTHLKLTTTRGKKFSQSPPCRSPLVDFLLRRGLISVREERGYGFGSMGLAASFVLCYWWGFSMTGFVGINGFGWWLSMLWLVGFAYDWVWWLKMVLGGFCWWFYLLWLVVIGGGVVEGGSLIVVRGGAIARLWPPKI